MEILRSASAICRTHSVIPFTNHSDTETYDGVLDVGGAILVDVLDPLVVVGEAVGGDTNELHVALREVRRPDPKLLVRLRAGVYNAWCAYLRATSASSVVHTGVKSPGWENRIA